MIFLDKKSAGEVETSPPLSPTSPFTRSYTPAANTTSTPARPRLDNNEPEGESRIRPWITLNSDCLNIISALVTSK